MYNRALKVVAWQYFGDLYSPHMLSLSFPLCFCLWCLNYRLIILIVWNQKNKIIINRVTIPNLPNKILFIFQFSSVQLLSCVQLFATPWIAARQASLSIPTPGVHSNSRPSSLWCYPAISSSVVAFSSCPQSLLASESFPMSQLFSWGGQSTRVSALASFLPKKSQGWSPSEWTGWISLQSKGLSKVFSGFKVCKCLFPVLFV